MSRKQLKRRAGGMVHSAIAGIFIVAVVCGVGFGVASADSSDDLARAGGFGFDRATQDATAATAAQVPEEQSVADAEPSALAQPSKRTIEAGLAMVQEKKAAESKKRAAEQRAERERAAQENAAALERVKAEREMQGVVDEAPAMSYEESADAAPSAGEPEGMQGAGQADAESAAADVAETRAAEQSEGKGKAASSSEKNDSDYNLSAVDWTVGQDEFVAEWTERVDEYLEGSPLEGYGYAFAEAAWENGVDPRWSPAIANTESSKGEVCFEDYNAWGWGSSSWGDWESAIHAHVEGLAEGYGYSITSEAAETYCPPNSEYWYESTLDQMSGI